MVHVKSNQPFEAKELLCAVRLPNSMSVNFGEETLTSGAVPIAEPFAEWADLLRRKREIQ
jgi:hypothetical protein